VDHKIYSKFLDNKFILIYIIVIFISYVE